MRKLYCFLLVIILAALLFMGFAGFEEVEMELSNYYVENAVTDTGAINLVTAILFDYRAFDTLGEATVIFTAASAVAFLAPKKETGLLIDGFSVIVRQSINFAIPFIFVAGGYFIVFGHLSPGGGFTGGVILAVISILWTVTFDFEHSESRLNLESKSLIEDLGALAFIIIGIMGIVAGANFLANSQASFYLGTPGKIFSGGIVPFLNIAIGAKVGAGLAIIFNSLVEGE
ncbi:hydrogen gas-evolving membrane-bound hydrogenase subunit E [Fuchsiella alkaliacetigena]|uniref:hydrogen gas-evolving membrane-bound hydrogenase subunit E n=1 Tax=Fuchsiella alkaliacetigena TaxID=957042 RepID=UPI00200A4809|nr:hydrogen gas-evolving membrane-bound hydrogenase subunit E [Fuchsiella alkaliacetigena]MCK8825635.1 sodium:proton antiporter [Fuchsiella alkaliacetigena]